MAKIIKFLKDLELVEGELILGSESFGTSVPTAEQLEENELFFVLATECAHADTYYEPTPYLENHLEICRDCGQIISEADHQLSINKDSYTSNYHYYDCSVCGATRVVDESHTMSGNSCTECNFVAGCGDALMEHDYWSDNAAVVNSDITEITYLDIPSGARFGPPSTFTTTFTCDQCGKQTVVTFNNPSSYSDSSYGSHAYRYNTSSDADLCAILSYEPLEDHYFDHNIWVVYLYKGTPLYCASNVDTNCTGITGDYCVCGRPGQGT
jgi:hypothetical protein